MYLPADKNCTSITLWRTVVRQAVLDAVSRSQRTEAILKKEEALNWLFKYNLEYLEVCERAYMCPCLTRDNAKYIIDRGGSRKLVKRIFNVKLK